MSDTIRLFCWVYGDKNSFSVRISRENTVDELKEAIVAKDPDRFRGIVAHSLDLWKVKIESRNKEELRNIYLNDDDALDPTLEIGDCFKGDPPKRQIHIIVKVPATSPVVPPTSTGHCPTDFEVVVSPKRNPFRWVVDIDHATLENLITAIRDENQQPALENDNDEVRLKICTPGGAEYSPKSDDAFRNLLRLLASKSIFQVNVIIEKMILKPYSSYKSLKVVLAKYGVDGNGIGTIRQFSPCFYNIKGDDEQLLQCIREIKCRLINMGTLTFDCNEAMRSEYISIILHTSLLIVRRITGKKLILSPQLEVVGEENTGRVDYAIKDLQELICITEGKQYDMGMGFAQNLVQCGSAMQANKKKRKADGAFGEDFDYIYGIVTTATEWQFILFASNGISCTSRRPLIIQFLESALQEGSDDEMLLCRNVRKVVEVIVGLLKDRVDIEKEPVAKRQRVEGYLEQYE